MENSEHDHRPDAQERLLALLALAAQERGEPGACPAPEEMAALVAGTLAEEQKTDLLTHLARCSDCYQEWLTLSALEEEQRAPARIYRFLPRPTLAKAGLALAAAISFVMGMWLLRAPDLADRIDSSYAQLRQAEPIAPWQAAAPLFPWERPRSGYGFGPAIQPEPASRAFGAGSWQGRLELTGAAGELPDFLRPEPGQGPAGWRQTEWADFYELGRWSVLLAVLCSQEEQSGLGDEFWEEQRLILSSLQTKLQEQPGRKSQSILSDLEKLQEELDPPEVDRFGSCRRITMRLRELAEKIAPRSSEF